jgi:hypothetical protein
MSAVKRLQFFWDRIILRGRWCDTILLNVHAPKENKFNDVKISFYYELECVFDKFPKYNKIILLGEFTAKVGSEGISKKQSEMGLYKKLVTMMKLEY